MPLILKKAADIRTEPLDVGGGRFNLVDAVAKADGSPMTGGVAEIWAGLPVDFDYDDDGAICFMLEGVIELNEAGVVSRFEPGDIVYVPQQAGVTVSWSTPAYGKFYYVTYPHWR